ncbi:MAG: amidase [bacterium]
MDNHQQPAESGASSAADTAFSLSRRGFIKMTIAGTAATMGAFGAAAIHPSKASAHPSTSILSMEDIPSRSIEEATIDDLMKGMADGKWNARSIAEAYLTRIEAMDRRGPNLASVIETNPDALGIADRLDGERQKGKFRGPLHGIPVLVKDNIATHDKMQTTAGSLALDGSQPPEDSWVAAKLREAGAVLLGKANLSEWAFFRGDYGICGWSARGGQCRNPYATDRTTSGSSSGSAVATSANLTAISIGTETNGSIVSPSSVNGVVGLKPTVGLVSRYGIIPIAHTQDTAGPITRSVHDAAIVLGALTGVDKNDPATADSKGKSYTNYIQYLDPDGLHGARIGVAREFFDMRPGVSGLAEDAVKLMQSLGAEIVDPIELPWMDEAEKHSLEVMYYEYKHDLNAYLNWLGKNTKVHSMAEVIEFNKQHADVEMKFFGQEDLEKAQERGPLTDEKYLNALSELKRLARDEGLHKVMDEQKLDAIVAPTAGLAWVIDPINGDHFTGGSSSPAAIAGCPDISVPMGHVFGLPTGLSFFGRAWSEPTLIRLAYAYEQASKMRRPPQFLQTANLGN